MPCRRRKATYKTKKQAQRHGAITYGSGNYYVKKVVGGWRAYKKR